jgi:hypothetical protein
MITKRSVLAAAVVFGALVAFTGPSHADQKFNNKDLRGTWGFKAAGFLFVGPAGHTPASAVGLNTYDGAGGCESEAQLNAGGTVLALTSDSCTYTVNSDGTGSQQTSFGSAGSFTTHFVLIASDETFFIVADATQPGTTVASGVLKRRK